MASKPVMAMLTKVSADVRSHLTMQSTYGAIVDMPSAKAESEFAKAVIESGRRITSLKIPTDFLHFQFN